MLFLRLFLANFNNFPIFWAFNAVKKNEIKKDVIKWTKENTRKMWKYSKNRQTKKVWGKKKVRVAIKRQKNNKIYGGPDV